MAQNGKLKLELVDVYGKRLQENVDISLRNLQTSDSPSFKKQDASKFISIPNLFTGSQGIYQVTINPR